MKLPAMLLALMVAASTAAADVWISTSEIMDLPTSGPAWAALQSAAAQSTGSPDLSNQDDATNVRVLAKALVAVRTGNEAMKQQVRDACMAAIDTELGGRTLALGRELAAYVIAADIVGLGPADDLRFKAWLGRCLTEALDGKTLRSTQEDRPNNWGTHAAASRAAVAVYLGDHGELARVAQVFKGWLGDRGSYSGFDYGDLAWQANRAAPVGINPAGSEIQGHSVDGVLPDDQRRAGGFTWPPPKENYVWEALQGAIVCAEILYRNGYADVYDWQDKALLRAYVWLHEVDNFPAVGEDQWQIPIVNQRYGTSFPAGSPSSAGKNMAWTAWTHSGSGTPPPVCVPNWMPWGEWSDCVGGEQSRVRIDANACERAQTETRDCTIIPPDTIPPDTVYIPPDTSHVPPDTTEVIDHGLRNQLIALITAVLALLTGFLVWLKTREQKP